jgi:hypothetical protein
MDLDADAREYVHQTVTSAVDPTGVLEFKIDATWYAMTWEGASVLAGGLYTRTGRLLIAGHLADPTGAAAVLTSGGHPTKWRMLENPQIIASPAITIVVRGGLASPADPSAVDLLLVALAASVAQATAAQAGAIGTSVALSLGGV